MSRRRLPQGEAVGGNDDPLEALVVEAPADGASGGEDAAPVAGPRIYVASLTDYNAGILHGAWIDTSLPTEEMQAQVDRMLTTSPTARRYGDAAEEWAIHDYDGFGPHMQLGEYEDLATVSLLARGISEHGPSFAAWWGACEPARPERSDDAADRWSQFEEGYQQAYQGEHDSLSSYAECLLDDLGLDLENWETVPELLRPYVHFDIDGFGRDMERGGDITTVQSERGVYVFSTH